MTTLLERLEQERHAAVTAAQGRIASISAKLTQKNAEMRAQYAAKVAELLEEGEAHEPL